ncbi:MAG TPA: hypothetical protein VHQ91_14990 [Geminicoccaceae bacterium]|nr:hypothetical protein [Geminicoccaceae bacterium]
MTGAWWPWLALAGLGAFHGINPAMGWLFAVALGLHRGGRAVVLEALVPIALGHALSIAVVALAVVALGFVVDPGVVHKLAGGLLIGWAIWHQLYGSRHRARFGMQTGMAGLAGARADRERLAGSGACRSRRAHGGAVTRDRRGCTRGLRLGGRRDPPPGVDQSRSALERSPGGDRPDPVRDLTPESALF